MQLQEINLKVDTVWIPEGCIVTHEDTITRMQAAEQLLVELYNGHGLNSETKRKVGIFLHKNNLI